MYLRFKEVLFLGLTLSNKQSEFYDKMFLLTLNLFRTLGSSTVPCL